MNPEESKEVATQASAGKEWPKDTDQSAYTKKLADADIFVVKCPHCSGIHFRHAGYIEATIPFVSPKQGNSLACDSLPVKLCVKCKHSMVIHSDKIIDVTEHIDLNAWEKTEKEAHKATGPGGQC